MTESENQITKPAEEIFDWDNVGKGKDNYKPEERQRLEAIYDQTLSTVAEHQIVMGKIIALTNKDAVVNIGFKSDGLIALTEFRYLPELKIGDEVEVYVESQEDMNGQLLLSHKTARSMKSWERVTNSLEKNEVITGFVKCRTKGGLIVDIFGIEAFLPGSQIDVKPIRDFDVFVGKTMEFKVVKINNEFKNVVVSHKILIEAELEIQKMEIMSKLEKGQVIEGTVKNITSYGVFMDLGGVDGLLHITDMSWGRISHPDELVKLDDKINVVIVDFDQEKKRIALGLKQLTPQPWDAFDPNLKAGDKVKGKVMVLADYGAFVEIIPGVEGLIHVSEMSWSQHLRSPQDFLKVGDEIEAAILNLDREERKISLGLKQLMPDPWTNIMEKYPAGSKHTAKVRNFSKFGAFVELEAGVDGLIHITDLSWTKKINHPAEFTKVGDDIEVVVLDVDPELKRISLGHKQLADNPWETYETVFTVDSVHEGIVGKVTDKGAIITFPAYGVEGVAPYRGLIKENDTVAKPDDKLKFKVVEFSKAEQKIMVSHTRIHRDDSDDAETEIRKEEKREIDTVSKSPRKIKDIVEKPTLGDIQALSGLRDEMKNAPAKAEAVKEAAAAVAESSEETDTAPVDQPKAKAAKKPKKAAAKKSKKGKAATE